MAPERRPEAVRNPLVMSNLQLKYTVRINTCKGGENARRLQQGSPQKRAPCVARLGWLMLYRIGKLLVEVSENKKRSISLRPVLGRHYRGAATRDNPPHEFHFKSLNLRSFKPSVSECSPP